MNYFLKCYAYTTTIYILFFTCLISVSSDNGFVNIYHQSDPLWRLLVNCLKREKENNQHSANKQLL